MEYEGLITKLIADGEIEGMADAFEMLRGNEPKIVDSNGNECVLEGEEDHRRVHELNRELRRKCAGMVKRGDENGEKALDLYRRSVLFDAPYDFDAFCIYLEWNRPYEKKFYEPRRDKLLPIVREMQRLIDDELDLLALSTPPGVGKALANDTPVLTRNGWKNHGDIVVGDEVIGMNGEFKKVLSVHPKCMLDVMVEFSNGERIVCHENHEWMVYDRASHETRVVETKRLEKRKLKSGDGSKKRGNRYALQLPRREAIVGERKDLFDPYTLGVWLGDGVNKSPTICNAKEDHQIIDKIIDNGFEARWSTEHRTTGVMYYGFDIRKQLQRYNMCHSRKILPKHIPEEYLTASIEQRLELIAGLIDTDGSLCKSGKYQFSTSEESLRDSFEELIATFGWRTSITKHDASVSSSGVESRKPCWVVSFVPSLAIPCALERKRNVKRVCKRKISIVGISRVEPREGNCITVEGNGMYIVGRSMLPTHNSTLEMFFMMMVGGRNPDLPNLMGSHSISFLKGMYQEAQRILDPNGEYLYADIFPESPMISVDARNLRIDLREPSRFETFEFSSIGSGNAGKVRAGGYLICDDLIDGIETAMSKDRLDKIWQQYYTDLRQRKIGRCKELIVGTRWSIYDHIGRLEDQYSGNPRAKFIRYPALDEHDESLWDYPMNLGFTTEFFLEQRKIMDSASFAALYQNEPIEREGQLYAPDELRRFYELPAEEPDRIVAVCDSKAKGDDYCVMPVAFVYGKDWYIESFICDNGKPEWIEERIVDRIVDKGIAILRVESNAGGSLFGDALVKMLRERECGCVLTTNYNTTNKETRILTGSSWVKDHCLFLAESEYDPYSEYGRAMSFLTSYTMAGKNKHDDVPDAMAELADFARGSGRAKATLKKRIF